LYAHTSTAEIQSGLQPFFLKSAATSVRIKNCRNDGIAFITQVTSTFDRDAEGWDVFGDA
jgi:hypothetical protein